MKTQSKPTTKTSPKTSPKPRNLSFHKDLQAFRKKYPMVYVEVWTPSDYDASQGISSTNWDDPAHIDTTQRLTRHFDASIGTNWDRIALEASDSF